MVEVPCTLVHRYDVSEELAAANLKKEPDNRYRKLLRNTGNDVRYCGVSHLTTITFTIAVRSNVACA
jgi:hypothetical protein